MYEASYEYAAEGIEAVVGVLASVFGSSMLSGGLVIAAYVLTALSLYTIAQRRGIKHAWMAWVPVLDLWILGSIADQYRYVVKDQVKGKRKALLILQIVQCAAVLVLIIMLFSVLLQIAGSFAGAFVNPEHFDDSNIATIIATAVSALIPFLIVLGISIAMKVIQYIALYDVYTSCDPKNNILYLLLSIFFDIALPLCLFLCRNKDEGMPPRKEAVTQQIHEAEVVVE